MENLDSQNENLNEISTDLDEIKLDDSETNQVQKPNFSDDDKNNNFNDGYVNFMQNRSSFDDNGKPKIESALFLFMSVFGIVFMGLIVVFQIILTPIKVIGSSMQPTINASIVSETDEDHSDIAYYRKQSSYENYDIVIIENKNSKYVDDSDVSFLIKRVIATENQTILFSLTNSTGNTFNSNYYYSIEVFDSAGENINFDDSFILEDMYFTLDQYSRYSNNFSTYSEIYSGMLYNGTYEYTVPDNSYFVMGDNRNNSEDSRYFGCIDSEDICGVVKMIVPYGKQIWQATILNKKFYIA